MLVKNIEHDLSYEERFLNSIGYKLIEADNDNEWVILDKNDKQIGNIQYGELENKKYGYLMIINSDTVYSRLVRYINGEKHQELDDELHCYKFKLKDGGCPVASVIINFKKSLLEIRSRKYGYIQFYANQRGLYVNFSSQTEEYNVEETLFYRNGKKFEYEIAYSRIKHNIPIKRKYKREKLISGTQIGKNELQILERNWFDGNKTFEKVTETVGTVEEMAEKLEFEREDKEQGIECFNRFRHIVNKILPFEEEVISMLVPDETVETFGLQLFIPLEKKKNARKRDEKGRFISSKTDTTN